MNLDFEVKQREVIRIGIYGDVHELHNPSVDEMESFHKKLKASENEDEESMDVMKSFVAAMGLPKDVCKTMEFKVFSDLCEFLTSSKKK